MLVAVILGNRINDDGSMSDIMLSRLRTALDLYKAFAPDKIILSGGAANRKACVSEAQMMRDYLVEQGVPVSVLVLEDKSLTTKQNAEFSVPIAAELGADEILLCTSTEHMIRKYLNPVKLFKKQLKTHTGICLSVYSK